MKIRKFSSLEEFESALRNLSTDYQDVLSAFGMDQKVLWHAEELGLEGSRKPFYRPVQEPA